MNNHQTLKLALAAATLGATGAQAAIVTGVPQSGDTTSVTLPDDSAISLDESAIIGHLWWHMDAEGSGSANVSGVVSAGTVIGSGTSFSQTADIDKVNQLGSPAIVQLNNGSGLLLPFEVMDNGHEDYGYLTFEAQATQAGMTSYQIDGFTYDDSGAAVVAGGATSPVPEPASFTLLAAGVLGLVAYRRRQHASRA